MKFALVIINIHNTTRRIKSALQVNSEILLAVLMVIMAEGTIFNMASLLLAYLVFAIIDQQIYDFRSPMYVTLLSTPTFISAPASTLINMDKYFHLGYIAISLGLNVGKIVFSSLLISSNGSTLVAVLYLLASLAGTIYYSMLTIIVYLRSEAQVVSEVTGLNISAVLESEIGCTGTIWKFVVVRKEGEPLLSAKESSTLL